LYSDGLVEALGNRDLDRGCSVLAELVKANTHKVPRITAAAVRKACLQALPEHADDMSLLILGPGSLSDRGMYAPGLSDPFGVDFEGKIGGETI